MKAGNLAREIKRGRQTETQSQTNTRTDNSDKERLKKAKDINRLCVHLTEKNKFKKTTQQKCNVSHNIFYPVIFIVHTRHLDTTCVL